jgi:hypothetical protein
MSGCSWNRSFRLLGGIQGTITPCNLPDSRGDWCSCLPGGGGDLLKEFPSSVTSIAQAIEMVVGEISKRLGNARYQIVGLSPSSWKASWQLGTGACDVGEATIQSSGGNGYPLVVQWSRPGKKASGSTSFQTITSLIHFLVQQFKQ